MGSLVRLASRYHRYAVLLVVAGLVGFLGRGALAQDGPPLQPQADAPAVVILERGSVVDQVAKASGDAAVVFTSTSFVNLSGARQYIDVPANARALIDARFTAESACYRSVTTSGGGWCSVRAVIYSPTTPAIASVEMNPVVGTDYAFDSTDGTRESASSWEGHAMERSYTVPASSTPRRWYVQIQAAVVGSGVALRLDDWHLTLDKARVP